MPFARVYTTEGTRPGTPGPRITPPWRPAAPEPPRFSRVGLSRVPDEREEFVDVDRLHEVVVEARLAGLPPRLRVAIARHPDDQRAPAALLPPELPGHLVPVHAGQADVQEDRLGTMAAGDLDR